jgi:hypothetical protein
MLLLRGERHRCLNTGGSKLFRASGDFFSLTFSRNLWSGVQGWQRVQLGAIAMVDPILVLSIFVVGVGCGYYLRDRISKKRRERYLVSKRSRRSQHGPPTIGQFLHH